MQSAKKKILIVSAAVLLLAVLAFLIVFHLPVSWRWSGTKQWIGAGEDQPQFDFTLDLKCWRRLFSHDLLDGTIVIDGEEYVYHAPANDPEHPEIAVFVPVSKLGSPTEWLNDYVQAQMFSARLKHAVIIRNRKDPTGKVSVITEEFEFDFRELSRG